MTTDKAVRESESDSVNATALIGDVPTTQAFSDEAVDEDTLNQILIAGINSPSAMNKQPWHFSVVTNKDVMQQIADGMGKGC